MQNDSNDSIYIEIKNSSKTKVLESSGDGKVKDLYQVQETWKFFFLTYIQLCVPTPIFRMSKVLLDGSTYFEDLHFNFLFIILHKNI